MTFNPKNNEKTLHAIKNLSKNDIVRVILCRIENEHLNNVGKYRAVKAVPLPFLDRM